MGKVHTNRAGTNNADSQWTDEDSSASIEEFCNPNENTVMNGNKFDKALIEFYMKNVIKRLKRKIMATKIRDPSTPYHQPKKARIENAETTVSTRYSGKLFSLVIRGLTPKQISVIEEYGMDCMLKFVKTDVPLRFVKWIASVFDTNASEIQLTKKFIPVTKQTIHNILDLPIGGIELVLDCEAGHEFLLSHFHVTSIPNVNFFTNKLISGEDLSDEDIFICFMSVCFTSFLCPNSSVLPSTQYFHIFKDCKHVRRYDLSKFVYDWLVSSTRSFKQEVKKKSKRTITFGGCHYVLAVSYLVSVEFGLNSLLDEYPRMLVWKGNRIRQYSDMDKNVSNSFGKRPLKRLVPALVYQVDRSFGKDSCTKFPKAFSSPYNFNGKIKSMFSSFLTEQVIEDIVHAVLTNNIGKPKDFESWSQSLVCDVLNCLHNPQHVNERTISNNSIGNLFQFKFPQGIQKSTTITGNNNVTYVGKINGEELPVPNERVNENSPKKPITSTKSDMGSHTHAHTTNEGNGCVVNDNVSVQEEVTERSKELSETMHPTDKVPSPIVHVRLSEIFSEHVTTKSVSPEVQITREFNFNQKYEALSKQTDQAYNKLKSITSTATNGHTAYKSNQCDKNLFKHSASHTEEHAYIPSSTNIHQNIVPRRYVAPSKRYTDPFVPFDNNTTRFPVLPSERRYYSAICHLGKIPGKKSEEGIRYEKAYCSWESLATLEPYGHIDNYLILCYCRKLFHDKHPSVSKKHFFFPYVGETVLRYNGNNGDIVQSAFEGANSAFRLWRSDQVQFPIVIGSHWFLFSVCLKAKVFAFCDSLYDEGDAFHNAIREPLVSSIFQHLYSNFTTLLLFFKLNTFLFV
ncbi:hypothetical protein ACQ4PT_034124 [Festuca glaucescens]